MSITIFMSVSPCCPHMQDMCKNRPLELKGARSYKVRTPSWPQTPTWTRP